MSEIRNIPDVKDASGIFKFDAGKKAISAPQQWTVVERPNGHIDIIPPIEEAADD